MERKNMKYKKYGRCEFKHINNYIKCKRSKHVN